MFLAEARAAAIHPTVHSTATAIENYPALHVSSLRNPKEV